MHLRSSSGHVASLLTTAICLSIAFGASAATPSFLCSKAKSWVEKTVCASDTLSELDMELATDYARVLKVLSGDAEKAFSAEQRKWWAERGACQKEADSRSCLEKRYQARITALTSRADYPGDQPRPREEFSETLIKEAGKGWSQHMSAHMKAIRACTAKAKPAPRAVLTVWTEEEGELVLMRLRGSASEDLICVAKKDGTQSSVRAREPAETLPDPGPVLWLSAGGPPKEACGKPVQVIDTDDTPVGWLAEGNC
jgi:uncharacterized protein